MHGETQEKLLNMLCEKWPVREKLFQAVCVEHLNSSPEIIFNISPP